MHLLIERYLFLNCLSNLPLWCWCFEGVVAHSTATPEAPAINIQKYESRTWRSAFVHYAVDWEEKIQIASIKYRAWGQVSSKY